nr:hypothetical protein [Nitrosomonas nitrosa]
MIDLRGDNPVIAFGWPYRPFRDPRGPWGCGVGGGLSRRGCDVGWVTNEAKAAGAEGGHRACRHGEP